ncbi:hypothetical protein Nocox_22065 [Nonomuraea coxensis DSM 45129]|uniref:Uncharacterized protein n=1 Tax=Nonomuraea coxensis DSM 45129 TaxID=1122611 RepID=A0ABX8U2P3_9ACTN|nr:hypothetical protein [Nonomuraea coxensis]QYC42017.1 hypothetical protein Nocox_22065 [Nonomuraea coxensis DSM 45129]
MSALTITLWDFTRYARTGPGEAFEDLDRAFTEAVALPLVFGEGGVGRTPLRATFELFAERR